MGYHWCKECVHRPDGIVREIEKGKTKYIEFTCPLDKDHRTLYYKGDFDRFKISCPGWEPYQTSMNLEVTS